MKNYLQIFKCILYIAVITFSGNSIVMAQARYWVGNSGNWNDNNKWSETSGGAPGASVPGVLCPTCDAIFDSNSFTTVGAVVNVNSNINFSEGKIIWSGVSFNPTWNLGSTYSLTMVDNGGFVLEPAVMLIGKFTTIIWGTVSTSPNMPFPHITQGRILANQFNISNAKVDFNENINDANATITVQNINGLVKLNNIEVNLNSLNFNQSNVQLFDSKVTVNNMILSNSGLNTNFGNSEIICKGDLTFNTGTEWSLNKLVIDKGSSASLTVSSSSLTSNKIKYLILKTGQVTLNCNLETDYFRMEPLTTLNVLSSKNLKVNQSVQIIGSASNLVTLSGVGQIQSLNPVHSNYLNNTGLDYDDMSAAVINSEASTGSTLSGGPTGWVLNNKTPQTLTQYEISNRNISDASTFSYNPTLNSGLTNYTVTVNGPASYNSSTKVMNVTGPGHVIVTVTHPGNATYAPVKYVTDFFVYKNKPLLTWNNPIPGTFGLTINNTHFTAQSSVSGTFTNLPSIGSAPNSGNQALYTSFIPTNSNIYYEMSAFAFLTVNKANPTIEWTPSSITYGQTVGSNSNLNTLSVKGVGGIVIGDNSNIFFSPNNFNNVWNAGNHNISCTFNPSGSISRNYNSVTQTFVQTINKKMLTVSLNNISKVYGTNISVFNFFYTGGWVGSDTQGGIDVKPIVTPSIIEINAFSVGTYPLTISGASDNNYDFTYQSGAILTVTKKTLNVSVSNINRQYGNTNNYNMLISGFVGIEDQTVLDTPPTPTSIATTTTSPGTYPITFIEGTDNNYDFLYNNTSTITISKATLTAKPENKSVYINEPLPSSLSTITYTGFKNGEDASVLDEIPTITTNAPNPPTIATNYSLTLNNVSDNNYVINTQTGILTVQNKPTPILSVTSPNTGVKNSTITVTVDKGCTSGAVSYLITQNWNGTSGNATIDAATGILTLNNAGQIRLTVSVAGDEDCAGGFVNQVITITDLQLPTLTITNPNGNTVVMGNTHTGFVLTENSDGAVSWSVTNGTGAATYDAATNTLTPTQAGTVTLTATTAQTATYAQGSASIVITVSPKSLTITGTTVQTTKEYNRNASVQITNAGTLDGVLAADVGQVTLTTGTASYADFNVGTNKAITFTGFSLGGAKAGNYTLAAQPTATTGSITAKPVSITGVTVQAKNYDGTTTATISNAGTVNGLVALDVLTAQAGTATFADANAGTNKTVNLTGFTLAGAAAVLSNYTLSAQPTALINGIISPAPTTVTFTNTTHTYDGTAKTITVTTTPTGVPNTVNYTPHATPTNAGTYTATVTLNSTNHIISGANTATLTINPATPVVTMTSTNSGVVNGTITLTANTGGSNGTITFERQNLTGAATLTGNQLSLTAAGIVQVRALLGVDVNYTAATSPWQTITISNLLTPTLTLNNPNGNTVVYGNTLTGFVLTENSDGAVSWSVTNGSGAATYDAATNTLTPTQTGTVTLTATTAQTANYAQGSASLIITISPKALMITGTTVQATKEYNRNASAQISNAGTLNGVLAADAGQVTLTTGTASYNDFNVGTNKTITFTAFSLGGAKAGNYTLEAQPTATTGSITAKPVSITGVTVQAKNYDGTTAATINNAGTVNGLIAPDVLTAQAGTATFADANAGNNKTVNLTGFTLTGAAGVLSNYTLSAQPQAISNGIINQATLTAVAENKSRMYGQANPTLTIQYTGFVNNETAAVLDQPIQIATTATAESNVGTYPITLTGGVDNNYAINKGNGILTITQATQTITVTTQSGTRALSNGTFTVEAFASSNLPFTVTSSNPAIASVNGNTITMHQLGEVTLTFSQAGNQNYLPATNVTRTFTIVNETRVIGLTTEALVEPVIVGFPHLRLITVSNTGNAPLTINNIAHSTKVTLDDAQFTIAAGATHTVAATLVVAEEGTYTEELVFESDATSGSNTITLNGEAFLITDAEESHQTEVKVGPNPGENFINIKGKIKSDVLIKDLQGRVMKRKLTKAEEKDSYILDIHDLPAGMFLLELKTVNDKSITKKIIKK